MATYQAVVDSSTGSSPQPCGVAIFLFYCGSSPYLWGDAIPPMPSNGSSTPPQTSQILADQITQLVSPTHAQGNGDHPWSIPQVAELGLSYWQHHPQPR
jgi:hypothetical protein